jgi:uncharacterized protein (AIM24 family)
MKAKITGSTMPVLEIALEGADRIIAEPGEFSWMTDAVQMRTTAFTAGAKGIWGALGRAFSGGGLFMTEYSAPGKQGVIAFAAKVPGSIMQVDVAAGQSYLIHRHGFLCATEGVTLSTGFQRSLGAGIFGGNGFVMQKLAGPCTAWIELGGEIVTYDLAPGESLKVHPGHVGMIADTVNFDVTLMRGFSNAIFGGDGLFIARLTGPGKVWLQTLTVPNLAHALSPYLGGRGTVETVETGVAGGIAGAVLRGMFKS